MALIPTKITARIDYWESKGLSKMRSTKTDTYKETIKKLGYLVNNQYMFENQQHTMPDFKLSVDRFTLQVLSPEYQPIKKKNIKGMSLHLFLYNSFAPPDFRSQYKHCLENEPIPINVKYPTIFSTLTQAYIKTLNNGIKTADDLSVKDHANLGWASNKIGAFCKNHLEKTNKIMGGSQRKIVGAFIDACKSFVSYSPTKFDTGLLTRKWVWEKFPNYLDEKGYLVEETQFSIYN